MKRTNTLLQVPNIPWQTSKHSRLWSQLLWNSFWIVNLYLKGSIQSTTYGRYCSSHWMVNLKKWQQSDDTSSHWTDNYRITCAQNWWTHPMMSYIMEVISVPKFCYLRKHQRSCLNDTKTYFTIINASYWYPLHVQKPHCWKNAHSISAFRKKYFQIKIPLVVNSKRCIWDCKTFFSGKFRKLSPLTLCNKGN